MKIIVLQISSFSRKACKFLIFFSQIFFEKYLEYFKFLFSYLVLELYCRKLERGRRVKKQRVTMAHRKKGEGRRSGARGESKRQEREHELESLFSRTFATDH